MSPVSPLRRLPLLLTTATLVLAACGADNNNTTPFTTIGKFRVVNAISDSTSIDVTGTKLPAAVNGVGVNSGSAFQELQFATFDTSVTVHTASGSSPTFTLDNVQVSGGQEVTAYYPGTLADNSYSRDAFYLQNNGITVAAGTLEVDVVHAASSTSGILYVYVTAPADALPKTATYKATYRGHSGPMALNGGSYRVRIARDSAPSSVIFDTGAAGVTLAAGQRVQLALLNETDTSKNSPILLYVLTNDPGMATTLHNNPGS